MSQALFKPEELSNPEFNVRVKLDQPGFVYEDYEDYTVKLSEDNFLNGLLDSMPESVGHISLGYTVDKKFAMFLSVSSYDEDLLEIWMDICGTPEVVNPVREYMNSIRYEAPRECEYYMHINHVYLDYRGQYDSTRHHKPTSDFDYVSKDLYPSVDVPLMVKMYLDSDESNMVLTGVPGTGKTCLAKMIMAETCRHLGYDAQITYVKDREILKRDEFWANLSGNQPNLLILDDLDDELLPRTEGRNPIVNNLLSFSDGIFDVKTKIIITTNLTNSSIDKAIVRPGRCFDILSLKPLTNDQAKDIWTGRYGQSENSFVEIFGKGDVSQAAISSEYARVQKNDQPQYLLDPSISIRRLVQEEECE